MNSNNSNSIKGLLKDKSMEVYDKTEKIITNTSTPIKSLTALLAFLLVIFFTKYQFNFFLSVSLALVTLLSLATINRVIAISFGFIYAYYMYNLLTKRERTFGDVIKDTDILDKGPLVASKTSEIIESKDLPEPSVSNNFSYQFWMYINGIQIKKDDDNYVNTWDNYRYGQWKSVFYRGDSLNISTSDNEEDQDNALSQLDKIQQYPGIWLAPKLNNLSVVFKSDSSSTMERIEIEDVPMNEWFCVSVLIEGYSVSLYLNGQLINSILLNQIFPNDLKDKNLYIGMDNVLNECKDDCGSGTKGGWPGFLAELIYYPYVLTNKEILESYLHYKKIVDGYQKSINESIPTTYPSIIGKNNIVSVEDYDIKSKTKNNLDTTFFRY